MIVLIFGDSITQGYWDTAGGWADRIKASVFRKDIDANFAHYHGVHNLGIDGNTTSQVIERFDNEVKARLWPGSEYGVIFAIGTNDTVTREVGGPLSSPEQYKQELAVLLNKARGLTSNIAFVNLCPVDEALTNPLSASSSGKCYTNQQIDSFNSSLSEFCRQNDVSLIDVHGPFGKRDDLLADGLHPNSAGHEIIYQAVQEQLNKWLP